ncbi:hypothetical protein B0H14DRAFT_2613019 [Mycena olivaceomarginata]|nr:hypothetical protein B0H14DRAFT_2613019 [Mycena olivaceomarginata]
MIKPFKTVIPDLAITSISGHGDPSMSLQAFHPFTSSLTIHLSRAQISSYPKLIQFGVVAGTKPFKVSNSPSSLTRNRVAGQLTVPQVFALRPSIAIGPSCVRRGHIRMDALSDQDDEDKTGRSGDRCTGAALASSLCSKSCSPSSSCQTSTTLAFAAHSPSSHRRHTARTHASRIRQEYLDWHGVDYPSAWRTWAFKALYVNLAAHPEVGAPETLGLVGGHAHLIKKRHF